jgi:hypothetical protein
VEGAAAKVPQYLPLFGRRLLTSFLDLIASAPSLILFLPSDNTMMQRLAATVLITTRRAALTNAAWAHLRITTPLMRHNSSATNKHGLQDVKPFVRESPQDWAAPVVTYEDVKKRTMDPPPVRFQMKGNIRSDTVRGPLVLAHVSN